MLTALYGAVLAAGIVMLVAWIVLTAVAATVDGWDRLDPETCWGASGRAVVAGGVGFGMAGLSVLYTTAPEVLSVVGAIAGCAALIIVSRWFGPTPGR